MGVYKTSEVIIHTMFRVVHDKTSSQVAHFYFNKLLMVQGVEHFIKICSSNYPLILIGHSSQCDT